VVDEGKGPNLSLFPEREQAPDHKVSEDGLSFVDEEVVVGHYLFFTQ
jgi:hypothetical protein